MRRILSLMCFAVLVAQAPAAPDLEASARDFLNLVRAGKGDEASTRLDAKASEALPPARLSALWQQIESGCGPLEAFGDTRTLETQGLKLVIFQVHFAKATLEIAVGFDPVDRVALFQMRPGSPRATPLPAGLIERPVTVGNDAWALPGALVLPEGKGPFPALILVHGSGPSDRDGSVGPNRPYRDLALDLARQGIAVLRYDKRTRVHAARLTPALTLHEETVADAARAVLLLRTLAEIRPDRIVIAGHSLGGYALPRIARAAPDAAAFISLAGASRPMEDLLLEQTRFQGNLMGLTPAQMAEQVARVKARDLRPDTPADSLPLAIPAPYWLDLRGYDPAREAALVKRPFLFLQGGRDWQVHEKDLQRWEIAMKGRTDVTVRRFPELNHFFMPAAKGSRGEEAQTPGHVAPEVAQTIAAWVKAL